MQKMDRIPIIMQSHHRKLCCQRHLRIITKNMYPTDAVLCSLYQKSIKPELQNLKKKMDFCFLTSARTPMLLLGLLGKRCSGSNTWQTSTRASVKALMWPFTMIWSTGSMKYSAAKGEFPVVNIQKTGDLYFCDKLCSKTIRSSNCSIRL